MHGIGLLLLVLAIGACSEAGDAPVAGRHEPVLPARRATPDLGELRAVQGGPFRIVEADVTSNLDAGRIEVVLQVENAGDTPRMTPLWFVVLDPASGDVAGAVEAPAVRLQGGARRRLYAHVPLRDPQPQVQRYSLLIASDDDVLETDFVWSR